MQVRKSWLSIVIITLLLLTTVVFVQRQLARVEERKDAMQTERRQAAPPKQASSAESNEAHLLSGFADGLEFERIVIPDAPFSATLMTETRQLMPDGSVSTKTIKSLLFRDLKGRTRRDWLPELASSVEVEPRLSVINDPVTGFSYNLDHRGTLARRTVFFGVPSPSSAAAEKGTRTVPGREQMLPLPSSFSAGNGLRLTASDAPATKRESIGIRDVEGVLVEGTRVSFTLHTPKADAQQAVEIVTERWYAPSLQTVILVKRTDPRVGETSYRLTDIKRSEPAAELFTVPAKYKIYDETGRQILSSSGRP